MINAPMTCLTLKETVKIMMVGRKTTSKKNIVTTKAVKFHGPINEIPTATTAIRCRLCAYVK